jgi:hypothetical protein
MKARYQTANEDDIGGDEPSVTEIRLRGPLEDRQWPETLQAKVVTPGVRPRVHGYDAEGDLAQYYGWVELAFLALTGDLPNDTVSAALNVAAVFFAPVSTAHAATHVSVLARLCGATTSETVGAVAIAMGERSRWLLDEHAVLLKWCATPDSVFPEQFLSTSETEHESVQRLRVALESCGLKVAGLGESLTRNAALLLVLHACGLRRRQQLEAAITLFCLPCAIAEAFREKPANFLAYPINLPEFVLEE